MTMPRWNKSADCPHMNDNTCPTCDFDRYYAKKYPNECPWAEKESAL